MRGLLLGLAIGTAACGSNSLKRVGETCTASSECDMGLLCDFNQTPAICANKGSLDAAEMIDAAPHQHVDARMIDAKMIDAAVDAPSD